MAALEVPVAIQLGVAPMYDGKVRWVGDSARVSVNLGCGVFGAVQKRRVWRVRWAQGGVSGSFGAVLPRSIWMDGKLQPISRPDALQRSAGCVRQLRSGTAVKGLERSVGPGRGVSGSFGAVQ